MLERIEGTITQIISRQQGKIPLKSGIEAFFVPIAGNFIEGKDETSIVTFLIGFRHDGLFAIDVRKITDYQIKNEGIPNEILADTVPLDNLRNEEVEEIVAIEEIEPMPIKQREYILPGPTIVGKVI